MKTFSGAGVGSDLPNAAFDSTLFWIGTAPTTWTITTPWHLMMVNLQLAQTQL